MTICLAPLLLFFPAIFASINDPIAIQNARIRFENLQQMNTEEIFTCQIQYFLK